MYHLLCMSVMSRSTITKNTTDISDATNNIVRPSLSNQTSYISSFLSIHNLFIYFYLHNWEAHSTMSFVVVLQQ